MKYNVHHYIKMAFKNKYHIDNSDFCGCYYCNRILAKEDISFMEEKDGGYTAICPNCNIDSVIDNKRVEEGGENLTIELLQEIHKDAF